MKPEFRFVTKIALEGLEKELNLKERVPDWESVAGYSYTPANSDDIDQYLSHYGVLIDDDKKFALMEMIIQAIVDQPNEQKIMFYWNLTKHILIKDYHIHEWTLDYWKDMNKENFENCKFLSPLLHELINKINKKRTANK